MVTFAVVLPLSIAWLYALARFSKIAINVRVSASIFLLSAVFSGTAALVEKFHFLTNYLFALTIIFAGIPFLWRDTTSDLPSARPGKENSTRRNVTRILIAGIILQLFDPWPWWMGWVRFEIVLLLSFGVSIMLLPMTPLAIERTFLWIHDRHNRSSSYRSLMIILLWLALLAWYISAALGSKPAYVAPVASPVPISANVVRQEKALRQDNTLHDMIFDGIPCARGSLVSNHPANGYLTKDVQVSCLLSADFDYRGFRFAKHTRVDIYAFDGPVFYPNTSFSIRVRGRELPPGTTMRFSTNGYLLNFSDEATSPQYNTCRLMQIIVRWKSVAANAFKCATLPSSITPYGAVISGWYSCT